MNVNGTKKRPRMHPINRILRPLGLTLGRMRWKSKEMPAEFRAKARADVAALRAKPGGFQIAEEIYYEVGHHPASYVDHECTFAAEHLSTLAPKDILDIGSYRHFILGLLAHSRVTTIDVRPREPALPNETVIAGDAKRLTLPDASFDVVTSLCALEHFGLGRYGDEFDPEADAKAMAEMRRVLRPGGHLILTTAVTRGTPTLVYNAHRIYSRAMIHGLHKGLELVEEKFFSFRLGRFCEFEEITTEPNLLDVYMGAWRKPSRQGARRGG